MVNQFHENLLKQSTKYTFLFIGMVVFLYSCKTIEKKVEKKEIVSITKDDRYMSKLYAFKGSRFSLEGDDVAAKESFNLALQYNPQFASVYVSRGMLYYDELAYDLAKSDFDKALNCHHNFTNEKLDYFEHSLLRFYRAKARIELLGGITNIDNKMLEESELLFIEADLVLAIRAAQLAGKEELEHDARRLLLEIENYKLNFVK